MEGLLKSIKDMLTYKNDSPGTEFELLESDDEKNFSQANPSSTKPGDVVGINIISSENILNMELIRNEFNSPLNEDIIIRTFKIMGEKDAFITYIDGMVDKNIINNFVLKSLMLQDGLKNYTNPSEIINNVCDILPVNQILRDKSLPNIVKAILNGRTALFIDGCSEAVIMETMGYEKRDVQQPVTETVVRGSHEAFNENFRTNITLIRKIIKNKNLVTEVFSIGNLNHINCGIIYIKGLTNIQLINEVKKRLSQIDFDFMAGNGILSQILEEKAWSIFPQSILTERSDRAAFYLLRGRVEVLVEGTPYSIILPITFWDLMHSTEDFNLKWQYGTFTRLIRMLGLFVATLLPGLYIALTLYHQEMIPTELLSAIVQAREKVPFPIIVEVIMMEISFELIREAGIRVPGVVGNTLGIIGALILGQAAVQANIVSPILIIVVAITGLGNFSIPDYSLTFAIRILRFFFIFMGYAAGFFGISVALFIVTATSSRLKCFGVPYFAPAAPKTYTTPEVIIRGPIYKQNIPPDSANTNNYTSSRSNMRKKNK